MAMNRAAALKETPRPVHRWPIGLWNGCTTTNLDLEAGIKPGQRDKK